MRLQGLAYRALNPVWSRDPLSGEGARRHGGRFNPRGTPALYTALDVMTAIREVSQIGQPLSPTTLVTYAVDMDPVFDATDAALLATQDLTAADLAANDWRQIMSAGRIPVPHALATRLIAAGYAGLRAPSYARGSAPENTNLILWHWGPDLPTRIRLIDPEGRLAQGA